MTTTRDIVTRAFRKIGVVSEGEALDADTADAGLDALNMMLHGWKLKGVDLTHTNLALSDTFSLDPEYEEGTVYLLAARLSPDYMAPASFDADDWFRGIQAAYMTITAATLPVALTTLPSKLVDRDY